MAAELGIGILEPPTVGQHPLESAVESSVTERVAPPPKVPKPQISKFADTQPQALLPTRKQSLTRRSLKTYPPYILHPIYILSNLKAPVPITEGLQN